MIQKHSFKNTDCLFELENMANKYLEIESIKFATEIQNKNKL